MGTVLAKGNNSDVTAKCNVQWLAKNTAMKGKIEQLGSFTYGLHIR